MPNVCCLIDYFFWVVFISVMSMVLFLLQDEEINQQSQLVEKLKTQMLDQEEVRFAFASVFSFHLSFL